MKSEQRCGADHGDEQAGSRAGRKRLSEATTPSELTGTALNALRLKRAAVRPETVA